MLKFEKHCCRAMASSISLPQEFVSKVGFPAPPHIMRNRGEGGGAGSWQRGRTSSLCFKKFSRSFWSMVKSEKLWHSRVLPILLLVLESQVRDSSYNYKQLALSQGVWGQGICIWISFARDSHTGCPEPQFQTYLSLRLRLHCQSHRAHSTSLGEKKEFTYIGSVFFIF